ncbi:RsfA family transcriptional regulator [Sporolactobacillus laevolacticus]|uniref:RsfA family transcriptional regulator n=1 Tax=Sporolactobacillus laevolacticus TaxID=33018 RepID=UPI0025B334EE|nr:RsfA family transcriptional regulator [Sporolactobacillus laevolacticus]MDN3954092.1 RsfA family transcriptional regulator [Sporolactobacillus laevolacticus]
MPSIRQDAWTHAEDVTLADTILRHIRGGSTQLAGFAEAGGLLSRTPAACGFRWNSAVRKTYEKELKEAKVIRKENKREKKKAIGQREPDKEFTQKLNVTESRSKPTIAEPIIDQMILFLNQLKSRSESQETRQINEQLKSLRIENKLLDEAYQKLQKDYDGVKRNYESLLDVLKVVDQARKDIPHV